MTVVPGGSAGASAARVEVRLRGTLAERFPEGRTVVEVDPGEAVERLVERLDLPRATYILVVNGAAAARGAPLKDGDRVQVYPPMAGG